MKLKSLFLVLALLLISSLLTFAAQNDNMGAELIRLDSGVKGAVDFPHKVHQNEIGDCNACHSVFPMQKDIIKNLKTQGMLKKQKVMNTVCIQCHRDMKKAGKESGPLTCNKCHN